MQEKTDNSVTQFETMQKSGVINSLENLKKENEQLQRIVKDITVLVTYINLEQMVKFIISRFIDYFVPETLIFMIKEPRTNEVFQYYYRQLKKIDECLNGNIFNVFKDFFDANSNYYVSGEAIPFEKILDNIDKSLFPKDFLLTEAKYIIPLIGIGGTCGIIILGNKITDTQYDSYELYYMKSMFSVFAISIQNELNYKTSITDPKTGLYSYDYFVKRIKEKIAKAKRYNTNSAILMLDIDHFKKFNDTYGHLAGDKILVELAKKLNNLVRAEDCIGRFGGEEFIILLEDCKPNSIFYVAERIRKSVETMEIFENETKLNVTVSIGGCKILPDSNETPKTVIKRIDDALYQSKANGRNQCTIV